MIGQHAKKNMGIGAPLEMVPDRPFGERRFHVAKSILGASEQDIDSPELVTREVFAAGLKQIAPVEPFGMQVFVGVEFGAERAIWFIITKLVIAGDTGVALLQAPDRLVDLGNLDELSVGDAFCKLVDIGAQAPFLLGTDGAIFGDALLA